MVRQRPDSNRAREKRVGTVIGSNHYGDRAIQKWGAYAGEGVPGGDDVRDGGEKGAELPYGAVGDKILRHMCEHDTLQAAMRFGRDGNGAVVYVHTDTLPEWVPTAGRGEVTTTWGDGFRGVVHTLAEVGPATTADLAGHPAVDLTPQQVRTHLRTLCDLDACERSPDPADGRRTLWRPLPTASMPSASTAGSISTALPTLRLRPTPAATTATPRRKFRKSAVWRTVYVRLSQNPRGGRQSRPGNGHRDGRDGDRPC